MKKIWSLLLAVMMILGLCPCMAESEGAALLNSLNGMEFVFSSGAGAWDTTLTMGENGAFTGEFHDSEMGETGEGYPDGTVYYSVFHGQLSEPVNENVNMWTLRVEALETDSLQEKETVEDGIRFVESEPYGLKAGDALVLYLPGTFVDFLPEGFLPWAHLNEINVHAEELPYYAFWNEAEQSGFISEPLYGRETAPVGMANPWQTVTMEELVDATGFVFGLPEGAEVTGCYVMNKNELAEVRFYLNDRLFIARIREADAFTDISGLFYSWNPGPGFTLGACVGTMWEADDDPDVIQLCLWYDTAPGLMYSLSMQGSHMEESELIAVAEKVYIPTQTEEESE